MLQQIIRQYEPKDFDSIVDLMSVLQDYFYEIDSSGEITAFKSKKEAVTYMKQAVEDVRKMNGVIYVSEHKGKIIGFIHGVIIERKDDVMHNLTHKVGKEGWVGMLIVDPEHRKKGIGVALLNKIRESFRGKRCTTMRLKVDSNNESAIGLYKKYGFSYRDIVMAVDL